MRFGHNLIELMLEIDVLDRLSFVRLVHGMIDVMGQYDRFRDLSFGKFVMLSVRVI